MRTLGVILCFLALPGMVRAQCHFRGYSSYSYPSYSYGSSYSYGGTYYPAGYYPASHGYPAGYYSAGYYPSYGYAKEFVPVATYVPVPFPLYLATAATVTTAAASNATTLGAAAPAAAPAMPPAMPAAAPAGNCDKMAAVLAQQTTILASIAADLKAMRGGAASPTAPAVPEAAPKAAAPEKPDVPTLLHARCAACHESAVSATKGKRFTMFVTTDKGPEMAKKNAAGATVALEPADLQKIEKELASGHMPPAKDDAGAPVPGLTPTERQGAVEFFRRVLAQPR